MSFIDLTYLVVLTKIPGAGVIDFSRGFTSSIAKGNIKRRFFAGLYGLTLCITRMDNVVFGLHLLDDSSDNFLGSFWSRIYGNKIYGRHSC